MSARVESYDMWGNPQGVDVSEMRFPVRCRWCGNVHDGANVTVLDRYSDCSVWACPGCGTQIDDRPLAWGGSAIPIGERR